MQVVSGLEDVWGKTNLTYKQHILNTSKAVF